MNPVKLIFAVALLSSAAFADATRINWGNWKNWKCGIRHRGEPGCEVGEKLESNTAYYVSEVAELFVGSDDRKSYSEIEGLDNVAVLGNHRDCWSYDTDKCGKAVLNFKGEYRGRSLWGWGSWGSWWSNHSNKWERIPKGHLCLEVMSSGNGEDSLFVDGELVHAGSTRGWAWKCLETPEDLKVELSPREQLNVRRVWLGDKLDRHENPATSLCHNDKHTPPPGQCPGKKLETEKAYLVADTALIEAGEDGYGLSTDEEIAGPSVLLPKKVRFNYDPEQTGTATFHYEGSAKYVCLEALSMDGDASQNSLFVDGVQQWAGIGCQYKWRCYQLQDPSAGRVEVAPRELVQIRRVYFGDEELGYYDRIETTGCHASFPKPPPTGNCAGKKMRRNTAYNVLDIAAMAGGLDNDKTLMETAEGALMGGTCWAHDPRNCGEAVFRSVRARWSDRLCVEVKAAENSGADSYFLNGRMMSTGAVPHDKFEWRCTGRNKLYGKELIISPREELEFRRIWIGRKLDRHEDPETEECPICVEEVDEVEPTPAQEPTPPNRMLRME